MWKQYNPNPMSKSVGDCVIRALTKVLDITWEQAFVELAIQSFLMCDMPSSNSVWGAYLKSNGFSKHVIPDTCPDCYTIKDFAKDHPHGTYAVGTGTHVVAVVNGSYYDSWDSGNETPIFYWRKNGLQ